MGLRSGVSAPASSGSIGFDRLDPAVLARVASSSRMRRGAIGEVCAMEDRWLSVDEIGEYLGVSRDTVYAWIANKEMPAHRVGRLWKFKRGEVDRWVRAGGADGGRQKARRAR